MTALEKCCRRILGQAKWQTTECLSPSQIMEATQMLQEGESAYDIMLAVMILRSWEWYRQAGLANKPPWEITPEDTERLKQIAPWAPREEQLTLFGDTK